METLQINKDAWNSSTFQAWINRFGTPEAAAHKLKSDPVKGVGRLYQHIGASDDKQAIINLLGSNGMKAVALAILGHQVTVVDFSIENQAYATELAREAGVEIKYLLSDVLQMPQEELRSSYDTVLMENGILHYFQNMEPLFAVVSKLLSVGGRLILQDFHPVSTKLISSKGTTANIRKHKVTGDYFDTALVEKEVAYSKYLQANSSNEESSKVLLRQWTLGEIVTAIASQGLCIKVLDEQPNLSSDVFDKGIPKTFTIIAEKI
ncbi:class I SAM-dependent methyltransferase [Paenibacillus albiflavus]|uniref:Class I SAM-dependent methyltransferase n=1 Tax=Paenibacillus albiflavus TaxID=2545760 RepID=A0A4V2WPW2_9BACL|nr:methyltransferase domain-containing protein [Paenibacillus albiflavus]TCZ80952.1 class I SAM-dependent methyltransferase [Paenibacillus albiflavus]